MHSTRSPKQLFKCKQNATTCYFTNACIHTYSHTYIFIAIVVNNYSNNDVTIHHCNVIAYANRKTQQVLEKRNEEKSKKVGDGERE